MGDKIVGIRKNMDGYITMVRMNNGRVLSIDEARQLAQQGGIDSLSTIDSEGNWWIADVDSEAGEVMGHNLDILPEF